MQTVFYHDACSTGARRGTADSGKEWNENFSAGDLAVLPMSKGFNEM
jgi:hypothetical protein